MNIRNGIDQVNQLFAAQSAGPKAATGATKSKEDTLVPDQARLSNTASQVALSAGQTDVRLDKVASIQSALQAGTYQVPAADVAHKVIDALLTSGH